MAVATPLFKNYTIVQLFFSIDELAV